MMWYMMLTLVFLFKQKTAYEMRISDLSSDVCSSYLSRREDAGDVLGSWWSIERRSGERIAKHISAGRAPISGRPECEGCSRKDWSTREAFADRRQRTSHVRIRSSRPPVRAGCHVVRRLRHGRGRHRVPVHRCGERPYNDAHDREDREQGAECRPKSHARNISHRRQHTQMPSQDRKSTRLNSSH